MFDEIDNPMSSNVNVSKKKQSNESGNVVNSVSKRKASSEQNSKSEGSAKQASSSKAKPAHLKKVINAKFCQSGQEMQMAVDDMEDDLFDTESSSDEEDLEVTFHTTNSQSEIAESEHEDGQIEEDGTDQINEQSDQLGDGARPISSAENRRKQISHLGTEEEISKIDKEIQQRILDLHDKMEENGLSGAVDLIEQLFNNKPGEDVKQKKKLKAKFRAGMDQVPEGKNANANRSTHPDTLNIPVRKGSDHNFFEVTIYQNAVQKRVSSSSEEDGLDISDKSNLLHNLIVDEAGTQAEESQ